MNKICGEFYYFFSLLDYSSSYQTRIYKNPEHVFETRLTFIYDFDIIFLSFFAKEDRKKVNASLIALEYLDMPLWRNWQTQGT